MKVGTTIAVLPVLMLFASGCTQNAAKQEAAQKPANKARMEQTFQRLFVGSISTVSRPELLLQVNSDFCRSIANDEQTKADIDQIKNDWLERNEAELLEIKPYLDAATFYNRDEMLNTLSNRNRENSIKAGPEKSQEYCSYEMKKFDSPERDIKNTSRTALVFLRSGMHGLEIDYPRDSALTGSWSGQREGIQGCQDLYWDIERTQSGEYSVTFYDSSARTDSIGAYQGTWWVSGDRYFERTQNIRAVDIYRYQAAGQDIHYEMLKASSDSDCPIENYTFSDSRR